MAKSIIEFKSVCERIQQLHQRYPTPLKEMHDAHTEVMQLGKEMIVASALDADSDIENYRNQCIQYQWAEEFKQYAILLRDIEHRTFTSKYSESESRHNEQIGHTLDRATETMLAELDRITSLTETNQHLANTWKHQSSPADTIVTQISSLEDHLNTIQESDANLGDIERDIVFFNTSINQYISDYGTNLDKLSKAVMNVQVDYRNLPESPTPADINAIVKQIETSKASIEKIRHNSKAEDWTYEAGHKLNIPVALNEGNLVTKNIDFDNQINDWVEREIVPSMIDMDTQMGHIGHVGMTKLVNIKNQLSHIAANPDLIPSLDSLEIQTALEDLLTSAEATKHTLQDTQDQLQQKVNDKLHISSVFDLDHYFLTKSPRTMITEYTKGSNKWLSNLQLQNIKGWFAGLFDRYISGGNDDFVTSRDQIRLVNFIKERSLGEVDKYYHSLFYSEGFLGQTFYQERRGFQRKFEATFENWKDGYPGSILVHGRRLSGKSTLLEAVGFLSHQYHVINLQPNTTVSYQGQSIEFKESLSETFKALAKYTSGNKVILIIDDLEKWGCDKKQFLSEISTLMQYMKRNARSYFFLVSTNSIMKTDLDNYLQFSSSFITQFDTSMMATETIAEIISTRERASQKGDSVIYDDEKLAQLGYDATKAAKRSKNNIGVSLIDWANNTDRSRAANRSPKAFKLMLEDHKDVLRNVIKWGSMKESEIGQFKNPQVAKQISRSIRELITLKVLTKGIDGELTIPNTLIDEIEDGLETGTILTTAQYG